MRIAGKHDKYVAEWRGHKFEAFAMLQRDREASAVCWAPIQIAGCYKESIRRGFVNSLQHIDVGGLGDLHVPQYARAAPVDVPGSRVRHGFLHIHQRRVVLQFASDLKECQITRCLIVVEYEISNDNLKSKVSTRRAC